MTTMVHSDVRGLRTQVLLLLAATVTIVIALWVFVLIPLRGERRACRNEVRDLEGELGALQVRFEDVGLPARLSEAATRQRRLVREWDRLRERVDTFRDRDAIREALPAYEDGRIDFKVALFEAREKLSEGAAIANVRLPDDLGIPETIGTEERAELRLWQLASTVRLIQLAIEAKLPAITFIESQSPVAFQLDDTESHVAIEFPTRMVLRCSFKHLTAFLRILSREGSFYALRRVRIERLGDPGEEMLEVECEAGAILFHVRNGAEEAMPPVESTRRGGRRSRVANGNGGGPYDG